MLYGIALSITRIITLTHKYRKWKKFAVPAVAIVGEMKDITYSYNRKGDISYYHYNYALKIIHGDQEFDDVYSEECEPGNIPITRPGKKINILWSIRERKYLDIDRTKAGIREGIKYACIFCGILGIFILPIIVAFILDTIR